MGKGSGEYLHCASEVNEQKKSTVIVTEKKTLSAGARDAGAELDAALLVGRG
jgi:hypothetical protein